MSKYCHLASVFDGELMHVVRTDGFHAIMPGDLFRLSNGSFGTVAAVDLVEIDGGAYSLISSLKPIEDDWIEHYHRIGENKEGANVVA